jgi:hypothetical protein
MTARPARGSARTVRPPPGKHVMPALADAPNALEATALDGLDPDRLNQLAECLFTLNNRRFGPIPGAYVVYCVEAGRRWCVGQLSADRAKPLKLFEDMAFDRPEAAQRAAEALRQARGEGHPVRSL